MNRVKWYLVKLNIIREVTNGPNANDVFTYGKIQLTYMNICIYIYCAEITDKFSFKTRCP